MPTYSYKCTKCGHQFDAKQRMTDDPLTECPVCGGPVRRVVGSVGIVFKGKGFYVTDHRSSNGSGRVQTAEKSSDKSDKPEKPKDKPGKTDTGSESAKSSAAAASAA
ncbi:MAG: FmdB family zinc ribbon protein [Candidatus Promineifilaceae bacterium]